MFGLFKKKENNHPSHAVFQSEIDKYQTITNQIQNSDDSFIVVFHFNNTGQEIRQLFKAAKISFSDNYSSDNKVWVTSAKDFNSTTINYNPKAVIVVEIHPLAEYESTLVEKSKANSLEISFYSAVDSPFFKLLGGDRLPGLMQTLGMKQGESIKHPMVSKAILASQEKILSQIQVEQSESESIEKWMEVNGLG